MLTWVPAWICLHHKLETVLPTRLPRAPAPARPALAALREGGVRIGVALRGLWEDTLPWLIVRGRGAWLGAGSVLLAAALLAVFYRPGLALPDSDTLQAAALQ